MKARVFLSVALTGIVLLTAGCCKKRCKKENTEQSYELGKLGSRGTTKEATEDSKETFSAEDLAE